MKTNCEVIHSAKPISNWKRFISVTFGHKCHVALDIYSSAFHVQGIPINQIKSLSQQHSSNWILNKSCITGLLKLTCYNEWGLNTYTAENLGGQVLIKLADDDSHIIVLKKESIRRHRLMWATHTLLLHTSINCTLTASVMWYSTII